MGIVIESSKILVSLDGSDVVLENWDPGTRTWLRANLTRKAANTHQDRGWVDGPCGRADGQDYTATLAVFGLTPDEAAVLAPRAEGALRAAGRRFMRLSEVIC